MFPIIGAGGVSESIEAANIDNQKNTLKNLLHSIAGFTILQGWKCTAGEYDGICNTLFGKTVPWIQL